ncbi:MAG: hypothetical protein PHI32_02755 [Dysgonamonadaceae bacterium]|nr:hypothetical protein [Dysgonamonadaceae bacterium]MDD4730108.1 hypothetical protein [Dysgonamonadaceae bacterium]
MFVTLFSLLSMFSIQAQKASAQATIQPSEILIGEQALINLQVIAPKEKEIFFPVYDNYIVEGLEVLSMGNADTTIVDNVRTINMKYLVTSFDSTLYFVPSMPISDGVDTLFSNSFGLKVIAPELKDSTVAYLDRMNAGETDSIDFKELQLNDIKPIQKAPFSWKDFLGLLWIPLIILLLLAIIGTIIYFIIRKNKKGYFFTPPPVLPAHIRAMKSLDKIKDEKIWQQDRYKEFYTQVSDVLRRYINERYGVNSLEMTSGEILNKIRTKSDEDSIYENLKQVLSTADLVKFAKYKPFIDENDLSLMNAYFFVNQTKEDEPLPDKMDEDDLNGVDKTLSEEN